MTEAEEPGSGAPRAPAELELERQLASLALSGLRAPTAASALQAVVWWNGLARLGVTPPLVAVHDLGHLLARPDRRSMLFGEGPARAETGRAARYRAFLAAVAQSEALATLAETVVRDELVVVVLARLLGDLERAWIGNLLRPPSPLPLTAAAYEGDLGGRAAPRDNVWASAFLQRLLEEQAAVLVRLEQLELGITRLLDFFPTGGAPSDIVDLHQVITTAGAASTADFSLQLLPSLLETKRNLASQRFTVDGYSSVERRGSVDALLPSELAHDPDIFDQRALGDELLYYGHERPAENTRHVHGILIDASASMRGTREVFARGLGIALGKKLSLMGADVWLSFFDSRLHRRVQIGAAGGKELPYVLCFRSEQGRHYARVFEQLRAELEREQRTRARPVAITFITHAECHPPLPVMEALARLASLYGIFVMPSQPLALDYLPVLRRHQIVSRESLVAPAEKRRRALEIVSDVVATAGARRRRG